LSEKEDCQKTFLDTCLLHFPIFQKSIRDFQKFKRALKRCQGFFSQDLKTFSKKHRYPCFQALKIQWSLGNSMGPWEYSGIMDTYSWIKNIF
jgi:hypothetical protein